jgi:hypothetical protein
MKLRRIYANAIFFAAAVAALGLAACMQINRQAAVVPVPTPYAYGLFYMDEGRSVKLAYGAANSDDVSLIMECAKGSRRVDVSDVARDGADSKLTLRSGGRSVQLKTSPSGGGDEAELVAHASANAAPLAAFRQSGRIEVAYPGAKYVIAADPDERAGVERFFSACDQSAVVAMKAR